MRRTVKLTLEELSAMMAHAIVIKGKSSTASRLNPYRRFSTRWYCWKTGRDNPKFTAIEIVNKLRSLGYPLGEW